MNGFKLKVIAVVTMFIDHVGCIFFPQHVFLRWIGRCSFPIYCFLIAEGARYTRNIYKYFARMAFFAVVSEIPFNLAFGRSLIKTGSCNVFFTLALGIAAIMCIQKIKNKFLMALSVLVLVFLSYMINCDYDWYGVAMIIGFYLVNNKSTGVLAVQAGTTQLYCLIQMLKYKISMLKIAQQWSMISIGVLLLYNGEKGYSNKILQWMFYVFYPAHLMILWALSILI